MLGGVIVAFWSISTQKDRKVKRNFLPLDKTFQAKTAAEALDLIRLTKDKDSIETGEDIATTLFKKHLCFLKK